MSDDMHEKSVVELQRELQAGAFSSVELVEACLDRIEALDQRLNRVVTLYNRYDYVRNYIDSQGYSIDQFEELSRVIRRALGRG